MTLYRKLFRDLFEHKGSNIATIVIIALGIMIYIGSAKTMDDLSYSKQVYYEQSNFPDAYAKVISAPLNFKSSLARINGIKQVEGKILVNSKVLNTNKTIRLESMSDTLGKYTLMQGYKPKKYNEILIDNLFAEKNNLKVGDEISVIVSAKVSNLVISGIARSAENIFATSEEAAIFSDPKDFGIAFLDLKSIIAITGRSSYNQILFEFDKGFDLKELNSDIYRQIESFGVISLFDMEKQESNATVDGEINELKATMVLMPAIFLAVAALVMIIMIKRIISKQRGQIGVLKAFGYSDLEVGWHYAAYCIVIGFFGGVLGSILGMMFSSLFINVYKELFNMPFIEKNPAIHYFSFGIIIATLFCVFVGVLSSRKAVKIEPAEAMKQEAPKNGKKSFVEKFKLFSMTFDSRGRMAVRNISRNRKRSAWIVFGLSLAFAISVMPWSMYYMMDSMIFDRYKYVEKYDAKIITKGLLDRAEVEREVAKQDGIYKLESMLSIPAKLTHKGLSEEVVVIGLTKNNELYQVVDKNNQPVNISDTGIALSERLASKLDVKVGDEIIFKSPYAKHRKDEVNLRVSFIVDQSIGMNGYMDIIYLSRVLGYKEVSNSILLDTDGDKSIERISDKYKDMPKISSVQSKQSSLDQTIARLDVAYSSIYFMALIALVMSFSIVYNIFLVVILEREREFATLMVLGMTPKEVLSIVSLEQWLTATIGVILGVPIAKYMLVLMSEEMSSDMYSIPSNLQFGAIIIASLFMALSIVMAQLLASKKIKEIDIVDSLKSGE